jgi:hypothetical protein
MSTFTNAREFLDAVVLRYRGLSAYSDSGKSHRPNCELSNLCLFETDYRAPRDFRFAFTSPHPYRGLKNRWITHVAGLSGSETYLSTRTYSGRESMTRPGSLDMLVAGATGISKGTAHTIAELLFEEVGGYGLLALRRLRFRPSRVIDGVRCTAVSGLHPRSGRFTAWFGTDDLLLRRLVDFQSRSEELRMNIRVGHALPDDRFAIPTAVTGISIAK